MIELMYFYNQKWYELLCGLIGCIQCFHRCYARKVSPSPTNSASDQKHQQQQSNPSINANNDKKTDIGNGNLYGHILQNIQSNSEHSALCQSQTPSSAQTTNGDNCSAEHSL